MRGCGTRAWKAARARWQRTASITVQSSTFKCEFWTLNFEINSDICLQAAPIVQIIPMYLYLPSPNVSSYATTEQRTKLGATTGTILWSFFIPYSNASDCVSFIQDPALHSALRSPAASSPSRTVLRTSGQDAPEVSTCSSPGSLTLVIWESGSCGLLHRKVALWLIYSLERATLRLSEYPVSRHIFAHLFYHPLVIFAWKKNYYSGVCISSIIPSTLND